MILINLLPHREAARKRQKEMFLVQLVFALAVGGLIAGAVFAWYQAQLLAQQNRNDLLTQEIVKLDAQIKDIAGLQAQLNALKSRQQAVENLQADRNLPVHMLNEIVTRLPDGVYLTSLKQDNQNIVLNGVAQSQERVSELLRNLGNNSPWLTRPELVEIVSANVSLSQREQRRVSNFSVKVYLPRAEKELDPKASGSATQDKKAKS
jgi:type IV pilus assembly protein PilN